MMKWSAGNTAEETNLKYAVNSLNRKDHKDQVYDKNTQVYSVLKTYRFRYIYGKHKVWELMDPETKAGQKTTLDRTGNYLQSLIETQH